MYFVRSPPSRPFLGRHSLLIVHEHISFSFDYLQRMIPPLVQKWFKLFDAVKINASSQE